MLPFALPVVAGAKVTLKLALLPAASVRGALMPLMLNPLPLIATCEMVTLAVPVLVTVSGSDALLPVVTLPKLRVVGLSASWPLEVWVLVLFPPPPLLTPWQPGKTMVAAPRRSIPAILTNQPKQISWGAVFNIVNGVVASCFQHDPQIGSSICRAISTSLGCGTPEAIDA